MDKNPDIVFLSHIDGYIQSFTDKEHMYLVWYSNGRWCCECKDWIYRGGKQDKKTCKHIRHFIQKLKNIIER